MGNEVKSEQSVDAMKAFSALAKAQQEVLELAQGLTAYKPVLKRLDHAMTAIESANLWLSAALMALGEMEKAVDKAVTPTMVIPPAK